MKIKPFTLIRIVISLSFVGVLLWIMRDKQAQIIATIKNIDMGFFLIGGMFFPIAVVAMALRLKNLLKGQGLYIKQNEAISLTFIGYFFNNFLPTSFGGDLVKAHYTSKKTGHKIACFSTVLMDRLFGMFSLFLIAAVVAIFSSAYLMDKRIIWAIFGILAALIGFFAVLWHKPLARIVLFPLFAVANWLKLKEKLERIYHTVHSLKDKKDTIAFAIFLSILAQLISFASVYFWIKGLGNFVPMRTILLIMPMVSIVSILPSINGLGIREGAMVFFFGKLIGYQNAFALSILWLLLLLFISIIGGLNYAFNPQYKFSMKTEEQSDKQRAS